MKAAFNRLFAFFETDKWKKVLVWVTLFAFIIYFFIAISAYADWFPKSTRFFVYSSTSGKVLRAFISVLIIGVGLLTIFTYRSKIKYHWMIVFGLLLIFNLISVIITPTTVYCLYKQTVLYPFLSSIEVSVSTFDIILGFFSFLVDIVFGYMLIFVYPLAFRKRTFIVLLSLFLLVMFYSFFYSFIKEREYYKYFFSGNWTYQVESIGSIFNNKQQWGIFLSAVLPSSCLLAYIVYLTKLKKPFKIGFYIFGFVCSVLSLLCSTVSFCKTAIICNILFIIILFIFFLIYLFFSRKNKKLSIILFVLFAIVLIIILLFFIVPSLKETKIGKLLENLLSSLISRGEVGAESRLELVVRTLENFPSINFFIGVPKGMFDYYAKGLLPELPNGLHTGLAIFFGRTGIFGIVVYFLINVLIISNIVKIFRSNKLIGGVLFGSFVVSFVLNLSELEILVLSSSMNVFVLNIVVVLFSSYYVRKDEENEKIDI